MVEFDDRKWRLLTAHLTGTASGYAGHYRRFPSRADAIAALRAITEQPDVLADAAAQLVARSSDWYDGEAVQLLLDAGADPDLVGEYVERRRPRPGGFNLGAFADRMTQGQG